MENKNKLKIFQIRIRLGPVEVNIVLIQSAHVPDLEGYFPLGCKMYLCKLCICPNPKLYFSFQSWCCRGPFLTVYLCN